MADTVSDSLLRANNALVQYPRFKELHKEIISCRQMSRVMNEPQCMSLEGVTGAGKSTLVRAYADSFSRTQTPAGMTIPVFYVEVPSPVGIRDLASNILWRMEDPAYDRGTRASMTMRLVNLIKACGVELVILDDFHHLIDSETNHILAQVSDWLKVLIKETGVPFLVVGIEGKVEVILQANSQLSRLFAVRETLDPFSWNPARLETIREFARFVEYVEQATEKTLPHDLPRMEMLYRVHYATAGVVGNLMNLMRYAALLAEERGRSILDLGLLSLAFQKRLAKHLKNRVDPFANPAEGLPVDPGLSPSIIPKQRYSKKRNPSILDTLSTSS